MRSSVFTPNRRLKRALKAWLAHNGIRFPKTHDLKQLLDLLVQSGIDPGDLSALVDLNAFAVQYRYESLFINEEALDRTELRPRIAALIDRVAEALQG
jgi:HEPN domain-containing protein